MSSSDLRYRRDLFVLPFDHRGSFESGLLGIRGRKATEGEVEQLAAYKRLIYDGFLQAIESGVPPDKAAILVDQKYGDALLADAVTRQVVTCVPLEKSGQEEFDFEYGDDFRARLQDASPTFAKVLVRYNPGGDAQLNERQRQRLHVLSDHTREAGYKFMFELLVPATEAQLQSVGQDKRAYDLRLRPELTARAMGELQGAGVEPVVWKLEGMEEPQAVRDTVAQAQAGGRDGVGIIILGRGENEQRVREWLSAGAQVDGVIGFAVGRTVFWQPLVDYKDGKSSREDAAARIAETYQGLYRLFTESRAKAAAA